MESYFKTIPCIHWTDWVLSLIPIGSNKDPTLLDPIQTPPRLTIPPGLRLAPIYPTIQEARDLSSFLSQFYYDKKHPYSLIVPPKKLLELLACPDTFALSLRDKQGRLVACILEQSMGAYKGTPCGLITWLCVHPQWRKQGLANILYYAITFHTKGTARLKWFRNDSLFQSPIPPIFSQSMMVRAIRGKPSCYVRQEPWTPGTLTTFRRLWTQRHPTGIWIDPPSQIGASFLQLWTFKAQGRAIYALVQPTYELETQTLRQTCEIASYVSEGFNDLYEETQAFEQVVDSLPWQLCEAPIEIPHIESFWSVRGTSTWSVVGLHPGRPFQRSVMSWVV